VTSQLFAALATRFALPEWVLVPQVRDATGWDGNRTADAVAMNCYPSKGLEVHGFEFKVSRSDWLRELRDGSKAEAVAKNCDRWWIVAPPDVVAKADLPVTWGLLVVKDGELRTSVAAPPLPTEGRDLRRPFVASFLRGCLSRATKPTEDELRSMRNSVRIATLAEERERVKAAREEAAAAAEHTAARSRAEIEAFERASGVSITTYDGGHVGEQFAAFLQLRGRRGGATIGHTIDTLERAAASLRVLATEFDRKDGAT